MIIPRIDSLSPQQSLYLDFLKTLEASGFRGDISGHKAAERNAERLVLSTDNSIYQVLPQGVVYPTSIEDLSILAKLSQQTAFRKIVLSPRGGGTGTNAQSLTDGIVVDTSKHMNAILEINAEERWARVQCGVVKDQLNAALKPFGLFFAPDLSTSNRATIGGMINTDASGQGSCLYGKTRDHVLELRSVLLTGDILETQSVSESQLDERLQANTSDREKDIYALVDDIERSHKAAIKQTFPPLNRCLTGYDLAHIRDEQHKLNLNNILCGSEGTLAFIAEAKLNLLPLPKCSALAVVQYTDFQSALRDANHLMQAAPTSIETIDSKVLMLAMQDIVWQEVASFFPATAQTIKGINLVEYTADSPEELETKLKRFKGVMEKDDNEMCLGYGLAMGAEAVNKLWKMRKKAVGLLGNTQGEARPVAFVEDTAVPPENLADFIQAFRDILDEKGLDYGMFGHVDAGVLHVRPALDLKNPEHEPLIREITDKVAALTHQYHGLLWGEHGKGVRSEYAPKFFGKLYPQLQRIKAAFDPYNQLNPGKIATPAADIELLKIDEVPTRGQQDRLIPVQTWQGFKEAVYCNGNGLCYNWDTADAMCPSWKVTRQRQHSPKGRASLVREWLKQMSQKQFDPSAALKKPGSLAAHVFTFPKRAWHSLQARLGQYDFSHEVHEAMSGCLACKSCSGQCPIKVDVPTFRSQFLHLYHQRYVRPLKDYLVGSLEFVLPSAAKLAPLYNATMSAPPVKWLLSKGLGFEDSPLLSKTALDTLLKQNDIPYAQPDTLAKLSDEQKSQSVILVQDAFTRYFDAQVVADVAVLLKNLGWQVTVAPFKANGKPLHVHGFLNRFTSVAKHNAAHLNALAQSGIPLIGIDSAMTLTYRHEYKKALGNAAPNVLLLQEWLATQLDHLQTKKNAFHKHDDFQLLAHCTEKTNAPNTIADWQNIFGACGQTLTPIAVGCCGMSGTYGHETQHREQSSKLFDMSWREPVAKHEGKVAATGYSCRSQTAREAGVKLPHPAQLLLQQMTFGAK